MGVIIIHFVPYTEIDWVAYMEQVATFQNGNEKNGWTPERNY